MVNGSVAQKPARQVRSNDQIILTSKPRYVSRGGRKLEGALNSFSLSVEGLRVLDAGSSTGGFTDCLLQHGAIRVYAVDVGTNQLHEKLRSDPRVYSFEKTNIKEFRDPDGIGFDFIVADLSFVSVKNVAASLVKLGKMESDYIILVKPQFEVGHRDASRAGGVIKSPVLWRDSLLGVGSEFSSLGVKICGLTVSPIRGAEGNVEFFFHFSTHQNRQELKLLDLVEQSLNKITELSWD